LRSKTQKINPQNTQISLIRGIRVKAPPLKPIAAKKTKKALRTCRDSEARLEQKLQIKSPIHTD